MLIIDNRMFLTGSEFLCYWDIIYITGYAAFSTQAQLQEPE